MEIIHEELRERNIVAHISRVAASHHDDKLRSILRRFAIPAGQSGVVGGLDIEAVAGESADGWSRDIMRFGVKREGMLGGKSKEDGKNENSSHAK